MNVRKFVRRKLLEPGEEEERRISLTAPEEQKDPFLKKYKRSARPFDQHSKALTKFHKTGKAT
jgi:hypothetical protein